MKTSKYRLKIVIDFLNWMNEHKIELRMSRKKLDIDTAYMWYATDIETLTKVLTRIKESSK